MKGKRVTVGRRSGKYLARRGSGARGTAGTGGSVRLIVCGLIFVVVVVVKLLFPQVFVGWGGEVSRLIDGDADFVEAFAAFGRAVSGEEDLEASLQDAYEAVFNPSEMFLTPEEDAEHSEENAAAGGRDGETGEQLVAEGETPGDEEPASNCEQIMASSAVYMMSRLPENASLEQQILNFSYLTPVEGVLTSPFGWREHPTEGGTKFHYGLDLAAEEGTDIAAFADGEVFAVGESSTLGKYIILLHAGGYKTLYGHCSEILIGNESVRMGDVIARVGQTGSATGPHLHFELLNGTMYFNPIYYVEIW